MSFVALRVVFELPLSLFFAATARLPLTIIAAAAVVGVTGPERKIYKTAAASYTTMRLYYEDSKKKKKRRRSILDGIDNQQQLVGACVRTKL